MQKKENSIVLWRIIFTYVIAIYHFDNCYYILEELNLRSAWYIAVEFFFIVSGFLMFNNLDKLSETCKTGFDYFLLRFRKTYPYYLGGFLLCFILYVLIRGERATDVLVTHVFELFCMHGIGLDQPWIYMNNTTWYLSVMLIAGFIIFHCLVKWKDTFVHFVAPIIVMVTFSYLFRYLGTINGVAETDGLFLNQALMRGLADMCLGIFAAKLNRWLQREKTDTFLLRLLGTLGFLFVIVGSLKYGVSEMDFLFAVVLTFAVAIGFLPSKALIFKSRFLQHWSDLTLCIYILHYAFAQYIFSEIVEIPSNLQDKLIYMCIYLVVITFAAILFRIIIKWCLKLIAALLAKGRKYIRSN